MYRNELGDMSLVQMGSVGVTTWLHAGSSTSTTTTATNTMVPTSAPSNANVARGYYRSAIFWRLYLFRCRCLSK